MGRSPFRSCLVPGDLTQVWGRVARPVAMLLGLCLVAGVVVAGMAFPVAAGFGLVSNDAGDSVNSVSTDLVDGPLPQTSTVTDSAGNPIARFFDPNQNRQVLAPDQISPAMKAAIVAVEDRRFYEHQGVDWQGTMRAVIANSASGDVVQGASTLTQQYVKNYFLYVAAKTETERLKATEQTPARKLKEAQIALQLERSLSKEEILARYLNIVSFGNGAAGIAAAARTYFNTTADQLTVPQAALLAGMVRSTTATDPVTNPEAALERRNVVIRQMREQQMIDEAQMQAALAEPLGVVSPLVTQPAGCIGAGDAGFFCKYVAEYLQRGRVLHRAAQPRRLHDHHHAGPQRAGQDAGLAAGRGARGPAERGQQHGDRGARCGQAPGAGDGVEPHLRPGRGQGGDQLRAAVPAGPAGRRVGVQDLHRGHGDGEGPGHQLPAGGAAAAATPRRSTSTAVGGRCRWPTPGDYPERLSLQDALALSPNTAFIKLEEFTGVPDVVDMAVRLGMKSLATTPFVRPGRAAHRPLDRRGDQGAEAGLVHPRGDARPACWSWRTWAPRWTAPGKWCPPQPDRVDHRSRPATRCRSPRRRASRRWTRRWRTPC